jgi:hypothetical protein
MQAWKTLFITRPRQFVFYLLGFTPFHDRLNRIVSHELAHRSTRNDEPSAANRLRVLHGRGPRNGHIDSLSVPTSPGNTITTAQSTGVAPVNTNHTSSNESNVSRRGDRTRSRPSSSNNESNRVGSGGVVTDGIYGSPDTRTSGNPGLPAALVSERLFGGHVETRTSAYASDPNLASPVPLGKANTDSTQRGFTDSDSISATRGLQKGGHHDRPSHKRRRSSWSGVTERASRHLTGIFSSSQIEFESAAFLRRHGNPANGAQLSTFQRDITEGSIHSPAPLVVSPNPSTSSQIPLLQSQAYNRSMMTMGSHWTAGHKSKLSDPAPTPRPRLDPFNSLGSPAFPVRRYGAPSSLLDCPTTPFLATIPHDFSINIGPGRSPVSPVMNSPETPSGLSPRSRTPGSRSTSSGFPVPDPAYFSPGSR